jgi:hypothetical protein
MQSSFVPHGLVSTGSVTVTSEVFIYPLIAHQLYAKEDCPLNLQKGHRYDFNLDTTELQDFKGDFILHKPLGLRTKAIFNPLAC